MKTFACGSVLLLAVAAAPAGAAIRSQDMGAPVSIRSSQSVTQTIAFTAMPASPSFSLAYGLDYSLQGHSCSEGSCSVVVSFAPQYPGLSQDAVLVKDGSGNLIATTLLHGIGLGPQAAFHPGVISTYAGSGSWGDSGDRSAAVSARLAAPQGVAVDRLGNLYIADSVNQVVRKVDTTGIISTVAGTPGNAGFSGDGGLATQAQLNTPVAVALDGAGNLFIADSSNNRIREVNAATGLITTVAGGGAGPSQADGLGDGGAATAALLSVPSDVCVSPAGELFVADTDNGLIREVDTLGNISIAAGGGSAAGSDGFGDGGAAMAASLATPSGVALDPLGNLYIADTGHGLVRMAAGGTISVVTAVSSPSGIRRDAAGDLFIADYANSVIRELPSGSSTLSLLAGAAGKAGFAGDNGSPLSAQLAYPTALALDADGDLYVADYGNNRIRKITFSLQNMSFAGAYAGQPSTPQFESLFNTGNRPLEVGTLATSAGFSQQTSGGLDCGAGLGVPEGTNCVLAFVLNTASAGSFTGTLAVTSNSLNQSGTTVSATLSGSAVAATGSVQATPAQVSFAGQGVGTTSGAQTVTLTNPGSTPLTEQSITLVGPNAAAFSFGDIQCGQTLNAGSSCTVKVTFAPAAAGGNSAALTFAYSGAAAVSVALSGTGNSPQATVSPATLDFGVNAQGVTSAAQTITLTNSSNAVLDIASIALSDAADFTLAGATCGISLDPNLSCTIAVSFSPAAAGALTGSLVVTDSTGSPQSVALSGTALPALEFVPMTPCRVVDTRRPDGPWGGPSIAGQSSRDFAMPASPCNIPSTAAAFAINVAVVPQGALGYLTIWPAGQTRPNVATINSDGRVKANAAIVPAGTNGSISVFASNTTDVVLDVDGYFVPKGTPGALAFYPVTPCRIADTRKPDGALGGPEVSGGTVRNFPILSSSCNIPASAQAYSLNFAVVPVKSLGYLTTWPAGQTQPVTSMLNALTGAVTSNANIAPAGQNGDISVFASNDTQVIIDINGYFAPAGTGGYSYFNLPPCRVTDTRLNGGQPVTSNLTVNVAGSSCDAPAAQAYVLNATVVPPGGLGYVTLWSDAEAQPLVSALNATDGAVTSNLAIVPANQGKIDFFGSNPTHLILDLFGFFE